MTAHRDPDRLIHDFLMEGGTELADPVYDAVRSTIDHKRQRVVIGPWRMPDMNKLIPLGAGVAAVAVAVVVGSQLLRAPAPAGVGASPISTAAPTGEAIDGPALTETFTSDRYGVSLAYPAGWEVRPATEPWTSGIPDWLSTTGDVIADTGNLWIMVASQPLEGASAETWVADRMADLATEEYCVPSLPDVAVAIDGAQGTACTGSHAAAVATGDRGYVVMLYVSDDEPAARDVYDQAWFEALLGTVQLEPGDAVDAAASAAP